MATDNWTFFPGCNYVIIGFGGNVTTRKKVQSSGRLCFSAGSNYNGKKLQPEKKADSRPAVSWKLEKITSRKKGTVVSSHWLEGKTQNTTPIIDTTTNKMSCATLPSSGFAPSHPWVEQWRHQIMAPPIPNAMLRPRPVRVALAVIGLFAWGGKIRGSK